MVTPANALPGEVERARLEAVARLNQWRSMAWGEPIGAPASSAASKPKGSYRGPIGAEKLILGKDDFSCFFIIK